MEWPEKPTCHDSEHNMAIFRFGQTHWNDPRLDGEPYAESYRTCSYCGSIHPEDLLAALQNGATLGGSDWKYGFPHKFYVEGIPNLKVGQTVKVGSQSSMDETGQYVSEPIMELAPAFCHAKFYTKHLLELNEECFMALAPLLSEKSGIEWLWNDGNITYRAPYAGYQHP